MFKIIIVSIFFLLLMPGFVRGEYTEKETYSVEVLENNEIFVKKITRVYRDGIEVAKIYHKTLLNPGQDTTEEVEKVKKVAKTIWTKEVVDEYKKNEKEKEKRLERNSLK
jgi:hypothetical protein